MTKVTRLGEQQENWQNKIIFIKPLKEDGFKPQYPPSDYDNIILIYEKYVDGYDLMAAFDDNCAHKPYLVLGHFNDGIV